MSNNTRKHPNTAMDSNFESGSPSAQASFSVSGVQKLTGDLSIRPPDLRSLTGSVDRIDSSGTPKFLLPDKLVTR